MAKASDVSSHGQVAPAQLVLPGLAGEPFFTAGEVLKRRAVQQGLPGSEIEAMQALAAAKARRCEAGNSPNERPAMDEKAPLDRINCDPRTFGGKRIFRWHRPTVEHVLGMLAAGESTETVLSGYPWME